MSNLSIITKIYSYIFLFSLLIGQSSSSIYKFFPGTPELERLYTEEEEDVYVLIMEFSGANFDYVINETFAPPSLSLLFKNVKWNKQQIAIANQEIKESQAIIVQIASELLKEIVNSSNLNPKPMLNPFID